MFRTLFYSMMSDSPEEVGSFGEMIVNNTAKLKRYKEANCKLYKDVYIDGPDRVNQIDHIFILKTGIFLIETKMFSKGRIIGEDDDEIWVNSYDGYKTPFLNPIIQNQSHLRALRKLLGDSYEIIPLVVFAWNNKPKTCKNPYVLNYREFVNYPLEYKSNKELSEEDIAHICHLLDENIKNKKELKKKHIEQMIKAKKRKI